MNKTSVDTIKAQVDRLPSDPGVYIFRDRKGQMLYVGKAKELRTRVRNYFQEGGDGRMHLYLWLDRIAELETIVTETEQEALILENNLIKKHRPRFNIVLRDDKTYVHVRLNVDHPFPRLTVVRRPRKDKSLYFGPYASAGSVRASLRTLGRTFPMRTCSDAELNNRKRPCLYYYIKRCPAPCVGKVDAGVYQETVTRVSMFLKGRGDELLKKLKDKMHLQAVERRYEDAARTRDQLYAVQKILEKQRISAFNQADRDVFGVHRDGDKMVIQALHVRDGEMTGGNAHYFENASLSTGEHLASFLGQFYQSGAALPKEVLVSTSLDDGAVLEAYLSKRKRRKVKVLVPQRGEKKHQVAMAVKNAVTYFEEQGVTGRNKELLEELQDLLDLRSFPHKIECFDVSNLHGKQAVASQVTFIDAEPAKTHYRHYRVKTIEGANDYGMMKEILERRIARGVKERDLPDLLLVDGGRGQLNVALKVADHLGVEDMDILGIAKVRDEGGQRKIKGKERIHSPHMPEPLLLEGTSEALFLLERVRDEAHRFAIGYHKRLRGKQLERSAVDTIPGVGPVLKRRLLAAFGSVDGLRRAAVAELTAVQGVSSALAARIKEHLGTSS